MEHIISLHFDASFNQKSKKGSYGWVLQITPKDCIEGGGIIYPCRDINYGEFYALMKGLEYAKELNPKLLNIYGDSFCAIKMLQGRRQINLIRLKALRLRCLKLLDGIQWNCSVVNRKRNKKAHQQARKHFKPFQPASSERISAAVSSSSSPVT